jgi:uncharacterized membrane protein YoaK (UPF0700 family)
MRDYVARNRDFFESAVLALVLPFVAGAVNASGFFIVGVYTSHMTGSVARFGDELAQGHVGTAMIAATLVIAFFAGATTATALVEKARRARRARYASALSCEAATLLIVMLLGIAEPKNIHFLRELTTALLCFSMGAQNALVTKLSGAVVRTTHLTGIVTDIGIETVRVSSWFWKATHGRRMSQRFVHLWRIRQHAELNRLRLHSAIFGSFALGAIVGPWLYLHHGYLSMSFPIVVLLGLVGFDSAFGFKFNRHRSPTADHTIPPLPADSPPQALEAPRGRPHLRVVQSDAPLPTDKVGSPPVGEDSDTDPAA